MRNFQLKFDPDALKEWQRLDGSIKKELRAHLAKRLKSPIVESARLHGDLHNCFKIKSKRSGYRLIYTVEQGVFVVIVIAIGKREDLSAYKAAQKRHPHP